jgi:RNA polymerase sigma-70 factor, ECF subfamily
MASMNATQPAPSLAASGRRAAIEAFVREHHAFTWRCLRRLGLAPADADEAAQRVLIVATGRLHDIRPGAERAFLFRTATHVAAKVRRSAGRRPETPYGDAAEEIAAELPLADELLDQRRARQLLDRALTDLPEELAAVIILFELEGLTTSEVAAALDLRPGTVASRLKRARVELEKRVLFHRRQAQHQESSR